MSRAQLAALLEYQGELATFTISSSAIASAVRRVPARVELNEADELEETREVRPSLAQTVSAPLSVASPPSDALAHEARGAPAALPPSCAAGPPQGAFSLQLVREELGECTRCKLHTTRKNIVFGVGNPKAQIVFVGEGPGADEDRLGEPFVGKAGELLTKMIQAMGFERGDVYIANVVKCRPPNNRDPEPDEVAACDPFLLKQLQAIQPKVIVSLGKHAAHALLGVTTPITRLRGKWQTFHGTKMMPTFHPAYLLRDPTQKRVVWEDLKAVLAELKS